MLTVVIVGLFILPLLFAIVGIAIANRSWG
jgi:hypothetical protein